jgi:ribosome recycling factor
MAAEDLELVHGEAKQAMDRSVHGLRAELQKVRTGRASTALLDGIQVEYYGTQTPMNQLANMSTPDPRLIVISPYDKSTIAAIEKAVLTSNLGLTPSSDGKVVRIPIPSLTEERRKELVKVVRHEAETARVAVRNLRRDAIHHLKEALKKKEISENDERRAQDEVQKATDRHIGGIDQLLLQKEAELLAV